MRTDWVPLSASALVIGAMSLVFGALLNPAPPGASTQETLVHVQTAGNRWVAMSVMFLIGSIALTLGVPSVLSLFERRGRRLGLLGLGIFTVGAIGTCGYAMLLVFFQAVAGFLNAHEVDQAVQQPALRAFLLGWVVAFYLGTLLLAVALLVSRATARWVPWVMLGFVLTQPLASHLGRVGTAVQVLALAVAFTGVATASVDRAHHRALTHTGRL